MSLRLLLYKTLVRSIKARYAASICDLRPTTLVTNHEALQNRSEHFMYFNYHRTASCMKTTLYLPLLSLRREISRFGLFYQIYHLNLSLKIIIYSLTSHTFLRELVII